MVTERRDSIDKGTDRNGRQSEQRPSSESDDLSWSLYEILRQGARRETRKGQGDDDQGHR
jgi:hypothetical protein